MDIHLKLFENVFFFLVKSKTDLCSFQTIHSFTLKIKMSTQCYHKIRSAAGDGGAGIASTSCGM